LAGGALATGALAAAAGLAETAPDAGVAAAGGGGTMPGAGASGRAGFLPYRGAFGSQFWFLRDSAASCSGVRPWPLLRKGMGTLVTYTATARAAARPSTTPMMTPMMMEPRCLLSCFTSFAVR
jgi:hypothetical protein